MPPKIDLAREIKTKGYYMKGVYYPPRRKRTWLKALLAVFIFIMAGLFAFSWQVYSSYQKNSLPQKNAHRLIQNFGDSLKTLLVLSGISQPPSRWLKGEKQGRINILLLGIGGKGHDGPYLSDTIMVASIDPVKKRIALLSIPRDLYVPIAGYGWHKINHANAFGEAFHPGTGGELASKTVSKILGIPIDYYIRVDFSGFKDIINDIGGVKIYVDRSFTDHLYPTPNHGYQTISFKKGWQLMDGKRALEYARSRHGNNGENSDFARAARQQKILLAVKKKLASYHFWLSPGAIGKVLADLNNHIATNLKPWEIIRLAKIVKSCDLHHIYHTVLTNGPAGQLYATNIDGTYALLPKGNNFNLLKNIAQNIFTYAANHSSPHPPTVIIENGTNLPGLAARSAQMLKEDGFQIVKIGNAPRQQGETYNRTIIYSLNHNRPNALKFLKNKFNAVVSLSVPEWLTSNLTNGTEINLEKNTSSSADFIIILGNNAI